MGNEDFWMHWRLLVATLKARTLRPLRHPSFVLYFVVAVLLIGASGVWLELHKLVFPGVGSPSFAAMRTALATFFPALAGSSCMQVILAEDQQKSLRAVSILLLTVLSVMAIVIAPASVGDVTALAIATLGSIVALWAWWFANAQQRDFQDGVDAPIGKGDPKADLTGTLAGFTA